MGCRRTGEKATLLRLVFADGEYRLDAPQTAPGRGAYVHPGCGAAALKRKAVPRALRASGRPEQLAALLATLDAPAG